MDILIIIGLILAAVILFLAELFLFPGISLAGLGALACIVYANYYAFTTLGAVSGSVVIIVSALACTGSLIWFMRSKTLDKISLKKKIDSQVPNYSGEVSVGDKGICTTRLAQIGYADFNGKIIEVRSIDGFTDEHTPIVVKRITDGIVLVEKMN